MLIFSLILIYIIVVVIVFALYSLCVILCDVCCVLLHYATSRKVAGLIPDGIIRFLQLT
jgi:hypothetical protein